jgi:DNA-binding transcriptional regulator GbsR (MarR family)
MTTMMMTFSNRAEFVAYHMAQLLSLRAERQRQALRTQGHQQRYGRTRAAVAAVLQGAPGPLTRMDLVTATGGSESAVGEAVLALERARVVELVQVVSKAGRAAVGYRWVGS